MDVPAAWRGAVLSARGGWWDTLSGADIDALDAALAAIVGARPGSAAEFPLGAMAERIAHWRDALERGRGFVLIRGLPLERYTAGQIEALYWGLGLHFGRAVSQNTDGDLLGHVRDTGEDPAARGVRLYRTRAEQDFHTDGADLIGLLCLTPARSGGVSRIVSSVTVFNELAARAPELVPTLFEPFPFDRQGQEGPGEPGWFEFPVCRWQNGQLATFFIPWYIRESQDHPDAPRLTPEQTRSLELMESIANEHALYLDMDFQPGDIQLLKNSVILHKRTAYEDWPEPDRRRHLLRLWLAHDRFSGGSALLKSGVRAAARGQGAGG